MIEIIYGRSGTGKTTYLYNLINKNNNKNTKFLIVPDQLSLETQKSLLKFNNQEIIFNLEVMGFNVFIDRIWEFLNEEPLYRIDEYIKYTYIYKILKDNINDIDIYRENIENDEFIKQLYLIFKKFKIKDFDIKINDNEYLKKKINLFKSIQIEYENDDLFLKKELKFDNIYDDLINLIFREDNTNKLKRLDIYVDSFILFSNDQKKILLEIFKRINLGAITFLTDESDFFKNINQCLYFFKKNLINKKIVKLKKNKRYNLNKELFLIENNFGKNSFLNENVWKNLKINSYFNIEHEVINVCHDIRKRIFKENLKLSNFCIYIPDNKYIKVLEKYLDMYELAYYNDNKISMLDHPSFEYLKVILLLGKEFDINNIALICRNKYFLEKYNLSLEHVNIFLNFINYNFFNTIKQDFFEKKWNYYDDIKDINCKLNTEKTQIINNVKDILLNELKFIEDLFNKNYKNIEKFLKNFYLLLIEDIYKYIYNEKEIFISNIDYKEELLSRLLNILEEINLIYSKHYYDKNFVIKLIILALDNSYFKTYPVTFDSLIIGDYYKTRLENIYDENSEDGIKHIYLLGMSDEMFPKIEENIIFNKQDIKYLEKYDIFDLFQIDIHYIKILFYNLITLPHKTINISFFRFSGIKETTENIPSTFLNIFNNNGINIKINNIDNDDIPIEYATFKYLRNEFINNPKMHIHLNTKVFQVLKYIDIDYIKEFENVYRNEGYTNINIKNDFTNREKFTFSELEDYTKCPYKYFLKYILKINYYDSFSPKIERFHVGIIIHSLYEYIGKYVIRQNIKIKEINNIEYIIDNFFNMYINKKIKNHPIFSTFENLFILNKLKENLKYIFNDRFINLYKYSNFQPKYIEYEFEHKIENKYSLIGKIDRIDFDYTKNLFHIIEYKTYHKKIDFNEILKGLGTQLFFYSYLVSENLKKKWIGSTYLYININRNNINKTNNDLKIEGIYNNTEYLKNCNNKIFNSKELNLKVNKDNTFSKNSHVLENDEINKIYEYIKNNIIKNIKNINTGNFCPSPIELDNNNLCEKCVYKYICRYKTQFKKNIISKNKIDNRESFLNKKRTFFDNIKENEND